MRVDDKPKPQGQAPRFSQDGIGLMLKEVDPRVGAPEPASTPDRGRDRGRGRAGLAHQAIVELEPELAQRSGRVVAYPAVRVQVAERRPLARARGLDARLDRGVPDDQPALAQRIEIDGPLSRTLRVRSVRIGVRELQRGEP